MADISKIQRVAVNKLVPYENNAKIHNKKQIEKLKQSIEQFGFVSPVLIDNDFNIIAGHGRTEAAKAAGLEEIPCVFIEGLTEKEKKAYIIADNRLSELGSWDMEILSAELDEIEDFNADMFDFKLPEIDLKDYYGDERERTFNYYNLHVAHEIEHTDDFWEMPIIKKCDFIPQRLIGFNYAKSSDDKNTGLHCFIDDYQFERLWNDPYKYIEVLKPYECFLSPDFSLYTDMTEAMRIWNTYRSRLIGAFYQQQGITVIPTVSWCEKPTFKYCFKGIEKGGVVAISTIGVKEDDDAFKIWKDGTREMIKHIEPQTILVYGGKVDFDYKDINVVYFENEVTKRWGNYDNT